MAQSPIFSANTEDQQFQRQSSWAGSTGSRTSETGREDEHDEVRKNQLVGGAAVAGGLVGLVLLGPVVGVLAAGGAALAASTSKGKAGQVARATGEVTVHAGKRLQEFDRKHRVVEKTSKSVVRGCHWVSDRLQQDHGSNGGGATGTRTVGGNIQAEPMT